MLELRPTCEHCNRALPPASRDARICSFECTFCVDCAEGLLHGTCPNCGGGFVPRPIRPATDWTGPSLATAPASTEVHHKPVDLPKFEALFARVGTVAPHRR
ncbi:MAG: DUF1272 domain-containing protein [Burkholderiales bacterium]|jgi:hypothetical protein|nr:DUF1272 domain-containing protein [Burkholderiales bacterium]